MAELTRLRREPGQSASVYAAVVRNLVARAFGSGIPTRSGQQLLQQFFLNGLTDREREYLLGRVGMTPSLQELVDNTNLSDYMNQSKRFGPAQPLVSRNYPRPKREEVCFPASAEDGPDGLPTTLGQTACNSCEQIILQEGFIVYDVERSPVFRRVKCFRCGGSGHMSMKCASP